MSESLLFLQYKLKSVEETILKLKAELEELKSASKLLEETKPKSAYKVFASKVMIELDPAKLKEFIESEIESLEMKIKALEKEREELLKEIKSLREGLGVGP
ncbi:hypothetical protein EYM_06150 [Ignicoccus islandicus DSM 13165]|uniref:Prefoldin subunit beta n=1 Tax=Ignicoccus islandicus DSM 13165 TaxID=940295 RepID=A0A0U3EDY6_9CREN|nr:prefoldin subunit [Ignicoccus islandicus]ALU12659.1 hypothetical protein EYM_06150 [Ignicoccus islandicus DSM 13165]